MSQKKRECEKSLIHCLWYIINSVIKEKRDCIDIMIYDIVQAFDSLWLQDSMNDIYDLLPQGLRDSNPFKMTHT